MWAKELNGILMHQQLFTIPASTFLHSKNIAKGRFCIRIGTQNWSLVGRLGMNPVGTNEIGNVVSYS